MLQLGLVSALPDNSLGEIGMLLQTENQSDN
jgi:hypothetical protein